MSVTIRKVLSKPDREFCVLPRDDLNDDIIGDEFAFIELIAHPLGKG